MKMRKHELREATERALAAVGIKGEFGRTNGGHCKIDFLFQGKQHRIFFSATTSDVRAVRRQESFMRRKLMEIGAIQQAA